MRTIRCHFDGKALIPEEPLDLPEGKSLLVHFDEPSAVEPPTAMGEQNPFEWLLQNGVDDPSLPTDLAANIDHYLYGTPKRQP